ncbi:MAG: hypothetical protein J6S71_07010 [Clostridia bacterium]|nr:hypothetical protein [Clostridia bacterium]
MKNSFKFIFLMLALILALSLFAACAPAGTDEGTEAPQGSENITEAPETEAPESGDFTLVSNGEGVCKIVRPSELVTEDLPVKIAIDIRKFINNKTGVSVDLGDDWVKDGVSFDRDSTEILIGDTDYPETATVMESLTYGQYAIRAVGKKIVVFSFTDNGYTRAMTELQSLINKHTVKNDDGSYTVTIPADSLNITGTTEKMTATLPVYKSGKFSSVTDMGDGCYGVVIENTTEDAYTAYLGDLKNAGYTVYAENDISGSKFATLYSSEYTVNAGFYKAYKEVRVIIEPYGDHTLPTKKIDAAPVTTSQVTMLGVEGIYNGEYQQNGMCIIYRLSDGSFVIVDGGHHSNSGIYATNIIKTLREQSKDYAKTDKDIRIAAWIISHPHTDHFGTLMNEYKQFTKFTFERIMVNFWPEAAFTRAQNATASFATGLYKNYNKTVSVAKEIGVDYVVPHVGQVWWFGDTSFEILYTIESYLPKVANAFNTSSIVFRTSTANTAGKETTAIITGDATGHALAICNKLYGKDLQCDIMQVAHHGGGTGGANSDTQAAYVNMKPSVILWPVGANYFATVKANSYNQVLLEGKNPNYAELYVAGWQGNAVTIPLPYTLGTAILNNIVEPKN